MDAPDRHNGQRDEQICLFVSLRLRWSFDTEDGHCWRVEFSVVTVSLKGCKMSWAYFYSVHPIARQKVHGARFTDCD